MPLQRSSVGPNVGLGVRMTGAGVGLGEIVGPSRVGLGVGLVRGRLVGFGVWLGLGALVGLDGLVGRVGREGDGLEGDDGEDPPLPFPFPFPELLLLQLFELFELFEDFPPDFPLLHPLLDLLLRSANELQKLRERMQILNGILTELKECKIVHALTCNMTHLPLPLPLPFPELLL